MGRETPWEDEYTLLCERCGYVLEGLDPAGNCPECGKAIAESLPERRVGTAWQRGRPNARDYVDTACLVLLTPRRSLDTISFDPHLSAKGFGRATHIISAAILPLLIVIAVIVPSFQGQSEVPLLWYIAGFGALALFLFFGVWMTLALLTMVESRGIAFIAARRRFRISPDAAATICTHGTIGWLIAAVGFTMSIVAYSFSERFISMSWKPIVVWLPLVPIIAGFLFFEVFAWLGLRRCKFANRVRPATSGEPKSESPS